VCLFYYLPTYLVLSMRKSWGAVSGGMGKGVRNYGVWGNGGGVYIGVRHKQKLLLNHLSGDMEIRYTEDLSLRGIYMSATLKDMKFCILTVSL